MAHQVAWTKKILESFIEKAKLSDDEIYIMESRVKGESVTQQSLHLNKSVQTVHRMIALLKKKYDAVQKEYPDEFPVRKTSSKETWMDTH